MADKAPEEVSREYQIVQAKEFYALGYRNYVVGEFTQAAEDLSRSCELYAKLYGDESEEVAIPNLFYGKTLIELAQMGENKVLALPDEEDDGNEDEDRDDSDEDSENGDVIAPHLAKIAEESGPGKFNCSLINDDNDMLNILIFVLKLRDLVVQEAHHLQIHNRVHQHQPASRMVMVLDQTTMKATKRQMKIFSMHGKPWK